MGPTSYTDELDLIDDLDVDDGLRALLADLRSAYADGPAPVITTRLASVLERGLAGGLAPGGHPAPVVPRVGPRSRPPLVDRLQSRRLRLGLGAAVAGLTVFGTGAAGALPGTVQSAFERTVEVVGIELPEAARTPEPVPGSGEGAPMPAPTDRDSGGGTLDRAPGQRGAAPGQAGDPPVSGPDTPLGERPGEAGDADTPGSSNGEDARRGRPGQAGGGAGAPADGTTPPGPPEGADRPGSGTPPIDPAPNDGAPGNSERPDLRSDGSVAPGQGASPPGRALSSDRPDGPGPR